MVPNSLGPAELLLHYGTDEQKNHYLPRLADGREIPCFALTGPFAGSDATVYFDQDLLTWQVSGAGVATASAAADRASMGGRSRQARTVLMQRMLPAPRSGPQRGPRGRLIAMLAFFVPPTPF